MTIIGLNRSILFVFVTIISLINLFFNKTNFSTFVRTFAKRSRIGGGARAKPTTATDALIKIFLIFYINIYYYLRLGLSRAWWGGVGGSRGRSPFKKNKWPKI